MKGMEGIGECLRCLLCSAVCFFTGVFGFAPLCCTTSLHFMARFVKHGWLLLPARRAFYLLSFHLFLFSSHRGGDDGLP